MKAFHGSRKECEGGRKDNNLLELIAADPAFNLSLEDLQKTMDPANIPGGQRAVDVLTKVVRPILEQNEELLGVKDIHV